MSTSFIGEYIALGYKTESDDLCILVTRTNNIFSPNCSTIYSIKTFQRGFRLVEVQHLALNEETNLLVALILGKDGH